MSSFRLELTRRLKWHDLTVTGISSRHGILGLERDGQEQQSDLYASYCADR